MKKTKVLIFPSGAENAINLYDSLKYNIHFELYGASSKIDHSDYIFDNNHLSYGEYNINDKNFFKNINSLINLWKIDYIFPTHDYVSWFLMKNQDKLNAKVICSPEKTCDIALSKIKTSKVLEKKEYYPKIYDINEKKDFPLFIKPDIGAGGKGAHIVNNENELKKYCDGCNYLITEYLPGDEITVDCFTDKNRNLLFIGPRTRSRIVSGVSFRSESIELTDEITYIANDLNKEFVFRGLWFFQLKKDLNGKYKLMEFSIRCAGTMALYRQKGINFAALSLFDFMGYDLKLLHNNFNIQLDRYYKCCYKTNIKYNYIYLDFDDTLIINNKVNTNLIQLIYQWLNEDKKIILLTKHERDIYEDLEKNNISPSIFYKIINIKLEESKVDYITEPDSIFIDNYFIEREMVFIKRNIPVFDVDATECLLNTIGK